MRALIVGVSRRVSGEGNAKRVYAAVETVLLDVPRRDGTWGFLTRRYDCNPDLGAAVIHDWEAGGHSPYLADVEEFGQQFGDYSKRELLRCDRKADLPDLVFTQGGCVTPNVK